MTDPKYIRPGFDFALACLVEECGEVLAAAGKTQRWGRESYNPELPPSQRESNADWLLRELDDLDEAIVRIREALAKARGERADARLRCGCGQWEGLHHDLDCKLGGKVSAGNIIRGTKP